MDTNADSDLAGLKTLVASSPDGAPDRQPMRVAISPPIRLYSYAFVVIDGIETA